MIIRENLENVECISSLGFRASFWLWVACAYLIDESDRQFLKTIPTREDMGNDFIRGGTLSIKLMMALRSMLNSIA